MKVVGTGAPRMLTIRFEPCELDILCKELEERRGVLVEAAAHAREQSNTRRHAWPGVEPSSREPEYDLGDLLTLSELLEGLRQPAPRDEPREVVGPTRLLDDVIRAAAGTAIDCLVRAVHEFREDLGTPTREELRTVLATAAAWVETLIGLDYADYHAAG